MTDLIEQELAGLAGARGLALDIREIDGGIRAAMLQPDGEIRFAATTGDQNTALEALRTLVLQTPRPSIGNP